MRTGLTMAGRGRRRGFGAAIGVCALAAAMLFAAPGVSTASAVEVSQITQTRIVPTGSALAVLQTLPVKGRAPKTGYDRTRQFGPAWKDVTRSGCDTRNDILRRDLSAAQLKPGTRGCVVLTGTLKDPYTGRTISFARGSQTSAAVQIDHVVALQDAWQSGAQQLPWAERVALANDPLNLLAVDGPTNVRKGAGNAATWLPPMKPFRCEYVARQVTVKAAYGLWVTSAERAAMTRILNTCPDQQVITDPTASPSATPTPVASAPAPETSAPAAPAPAPVAPVAPAPVPVAPAPAPAAPSVVHPGAFCSSEGATGVTVKGTPMVCASKGGDRARWRSQ